jgi:hypothetical protein
MRTTYREKACGTPYTDLWAGSAFQSVEYKNAGVIE